MPKHPLFCLRCKKRTARRYTVVDTHLDTFHAPLLQTSQDDISVRSSMSESLEIGMTFIDEIGEKMPPQLAASKYYETVIDVAKNVTVVISVVIIIRFIHSRNQL